MKYKFLMYSAIFIFMIFAFELVTGIYREPEYVLTDKATGKQRVFTQTEIDRMNDMTYQRQMAAQRMQSGQLEDNIRRIIAEQEKERSRSK